MLDTGSGPNIIKENFVPKGKPVNYDNILKLNGINEYPVYTLGKITLPLLGKEVTFHIVMIFQFHNPAYWATIFSNKLPQR